MGDIHGCRGASNQKVTDLFIVTVAACAIAIVGQLIHAGEWMLGLRLALVLLSAILTGAIGGALLFGLLVAKPKEPSAIRRTRQSAADSAEGLRRISGIGESTARVLAEHGVKTLSDLAALDEHRVAQLQFLLDEVVVGKWRGKLADWVAEARAAEETRVT